MIFDTNINQTWILTNDFDWWGAKSSDIPLWKIDQEYNGYYAESKHNLVSLKYATNSALDGQHVNVANITNIDPEYMEMLKQTSKFINVNGHISLAPLSY